MEELSPDKDQDRLINTVNKLMIRLVRVEELIKDISSRDHKELTRKPYPEGESLSSGQGNFPQSYLRDMMTSLSMPGMKFILEKDQPWLHSCLWIIIHVIAFLVSYVLIKDEYDKWQDSPVVKTVSNKLTSVNEIPFPAFTVCLPMYIKDGYDYLGEIEKCISCNPTDASDCEFNEMCSYEEIASLAIASLVCLHNETTMIPPWLRFDWNVSTSIRGEEFLMYSKNVFPHGKIEIEQFRSDVNFFSVDKFNLSEMYGNDGNHYINFVMRYIGLCFTMNGLGEKDIFKENTIISSVHDNSSTQSWEGWYKGKNVSLEDMIYLNGNRQTIPAYISENDQILISILSRYNNESTALCQGLRTKDAYVAIHNPVEVPFIFNSDFDLKFGEEIEIRVIPRMVITEKGLESYKPMDRGCFYSHEKELAMFKHYSEHNCKTECTANCSLKHCGCVPYYLPRHNSSVPVCLSGCAQVLECDSKDCICLPDCYSLSYDFEIIKEKGHEGRGWITMIYKSSGFYATVRVSLTNLAQFMAYCLGIVGVFNGFSVMMLFEIFYFSTFRLWNFLKGNLGNKD